MMGEGERVGSGDGGSWMMRDGLKYCDTVCTVFKASNSLRVSEYFFTEIRRSCRT